jgi:PAS domain S-box-containing protein
MNFRTPRIVSILLIVIILVVTMVTVSSLSFETRAALKGSMQDRLISTASIAASGIDAESFVLLQPGDENSADFTRIRDQLRRVKEASPDIRYIYTMRKSGDSVVFVVDGDYGYSSDPAVIGEKYPQAESDLLAGFSGPSSDRDFTTDQWGTVLSGYSPIRDSTGAVVGIVGVDMDSSVVMAELNRINMILYLVGIISMILIAIGIVIVERRRTIDEEKLEESEKRYRLLFERARDCILLIEAEGDNPGKIIAANAAAAEMHGYTVDELLTRNIADLDSSESSKEVPERLRRILGGEQLVSETEHIRKDGTVFPLEINAGLIDVGTKKFILAIDRDITERKKAEQALQQVTKKLTFLNQVTFNDIQNSVLSLGGFLALERNTIGTEPSKKYLDREEESVRKIDKALIFAKNYQDLGVHPPQWQNVDRSFVLGISHLDFSSVQRTVHLDNLEIYADSLLERVFFTLADNVLQNATAGIRVTIGYQREDANLLIFLEDNGNGIPEALKEKIFERGYGTQKGMELFLVREILSITGITIRETGIPGKGARFEMRVPKGAYRFHGEPSH